MLPELNQLLVSFWVELSMIDFLFLVPYRDFFMSIAYITGGQYVPMVNAKLLAQVIIGGVREEISLERLMQDAQEDIDREMKTAEAEGADEQEITARVNRLLVTKNLRVKQMENVAGATSSVARESYSKCTDMRTLRSEYKVAPMPEQEPVSRSGRTRAAARRGFDFSLEDEDEDEGAVKTEAASSSPAAPMHYDLKEDEAVSMAQTERIVQRMRYKK
jgi:hypothetical protein